MVLQNGGTGPILSSVFSERVIRQNGGPASSVPRFCRARLSKRVTGLICPPILNGGQMQHHRCYDGNLLYKIDYFGHFKLLVILTAEVSAKLQIKCAEIEIRQIFL